MAWTEKYVTDSGAGAHDGTSEADAWSWAEMLTNLASGERANVKGNVTTAAALQTWSGTECAVRGYSSTIGDLDAITRTDYGAIDTTGYPVITNPHTSSLFRASRDMQISCLHLKSTNSTSVLISCSTNILSTFTGCVIEQTNTNGELISANNSDVVFRNCDLIQNATTSSDPINLTRGSLYNCRITNPGNSTGNFILMSGATSTVIGCQFLDCDICITVNTALSGSAQVVGNSARNCNTFLDCDDAANPTTISHNVAWGSNAVGSEFYLGANVNVPVIFESNARGNFADADQNLGDWPDDNAVTLTADPFTSSTDLRLNSTSGGGADCKAVGVFGGDLGAIQSVSSGGGATRTKRMVIQ